MAPRNGRSRELPSWLTTVLIFGTVATVAVLEMQRPLRQAKQSKKSRDARNLGFALVSAATVSLVEKPVVGPLTRTVQRRGLGLLKLLPLPVLLETMLAVLLLDYTLYLWHYLTHKVPLLWRFHLVHHVDLDMDASTALRFHPGELLFSVPWRAAQVRVLGISPLGLSLWQTLTLMEILFHHSNLWLPHGLERWLCRLIVTPRMHGIHHSSVPQERDSNWSTIFAWPDYLHGTARLNVPQHKIVIGVAPHQDARELTFGKVMALPFKRQWHARQPEREVHPLPVTTLAS